MKQPSEQLQKKITEAQHRIEEIYNMTGGKVVLAFSGGKDSTVVLSLIKMCEDLNTIDKNSIPALFHNTGVELSQTLEFIEWVKNNYYSNVHVTAPRMPFGEVLTTHGKPIKSKFMSNLISRQQANPNVQGGVYQKVLNKEYQSRTLALGDKNLHLLSPLFDIKVSEKCCTYLKKLPSADWQLEHGYEGAMTGERLAEGGVRQLAGANRVKAGGRLCVKFRKGKPTMMPIIDWSDEDIAEFVDLYNIPLSKAYTEIGLKRTGCMGCPYSPTIETDLKALHDYDPNRYKAVMFYLKDVYIAQEVSLPFDQPYQMERKTKWQYIYSDMRNAMIEEYRTPIHNYKDRSKRYRASKDIAAFIQQFTPLLHANINAPTLHKLFTKDETGHKALAKEVAKYIDAWVVPVEKKYDAFYLSYDIAEDFFKKDAPSPTQWMNYLRLYLREQPPL